MERQFYPQREQVAAVQSEFIRRVYNWMGVGLGTTAIVAMLTFSSVAMRQLIFQTPGVMIVLILAELGLVFAARLPRRPPSCWEQKRGCPHSARPACAGRPC